MKTNLTCLLFCLFFVSTTFGQWNDSFDDNDFRNNPRWEGDTSLFEINASGQLHLNAPNVTGNAYLCTSSRVSTLAEWRFWVGFEFNPSSSNYARVYLMSDNSRLDTALNGYYLRIGGTSDNLCLYSQTGLSSKLLYASPAGMLNATVNQVSLKVTRNEHGLWTVSCDSTGETNYTPLGSVQDSTFWNSVFFGVQCIYTSTRSKGFLFDDFVVTGKSSTDSVAPKILQAHAMNDSMILIDFSENIKPSVLTDLTHYHCDNKHSVSRILPGEGAQGIIYLNGPLACNDPMILSVNHLEDMCGNLLRDTTVEITYCPGTTYDVVITEIMADPDPVVGLPNIEYLELKNRSNHSQDLDGWILQIGDDKKQINDLILPGDSFLIVTARGGCSLLKPPGKCLELLSTYDLNNSGEYVGLKNRSGQLIHWVNYSDSWYQDDLKKDGGWSLEMVDYSQPCLGRENWKASTDPLGGSPGRINAVNGSTFSETLFDYDKLYLPNDSVVRIYFNLPVDANAIDKEMFVLDGQIPDKIGIDTLKRSYVDIYGRELFAKDKEYQLTIASSLLSCNGSKLTQELVLPFMLPETALTGEFIINEVLFDAMPGKQEFLELYNNSDKFLCSTDYKISYRNAEGSYEETYHLDDIPFLIPPHTFLAVTNLKNEFDVNYHLPQPRWLLESSGFPALSNEKGVVAIFNTSLQKLDEFEYAASMQSSMLMNTSGVSLERIRYSSSSNEPDNWHSAASTADYATPGAINSQYLEDTVTNKEFKLEPEIFSPDNDGYEDITTLEYQLDQSGYEATIMVFDAEGRRVKLIANNLPIGTNGNFNWDGTDDHHNRVDTGIYLIYVEVHHSLGILKKYKLSCVVAGERKH